MNFDRSLIFAYLEEDNIQRAYFRVLPLLTLDGDVRQEAVQLWPNEGGLRIVPDRNEQHTFKMRMRNLGSFCVVDLRNQPPEAGKIRTNKNYRPDRGELNQYILYSDTVHELPENTFYQLLDGRADEYTSLAEKAITPLFYIRQEDTLYGPVKKSAASQPSPAKEAAAMLYEIACPDGVTRFMLCMEDASILPKKEEMPVPSKDSKHTEKADASKEASVNEPKPLDIPEAANASDDQTNDLPIGKSLNILDQAKGHEETLKQLDKPVSTGANLLHQKQDKPVFEPQSAPRTENLGGTPLVRTPFHVSIQQTKNHTQEIVNNQLNVGKYEPPAQNLPAGTAMRPIDNPVEAACTHLREAWNATSAHDQLTDCMLSLDGIRSILEAKLCSGSTGTMLQRVLQQRLQDLEAERLTALCELDRARRDVDAYKQEFITAYSARINRETAKIEADRQSAEKYLSSLTAEINALTLQRDALLAKVNEIQQATLPEAVAKLVADAQMAALPSGTPLRMSPVSGKQIPIDVILQQVQSACAASGLNVDRNTAIALLVLLANSPRIGFACATPAPAATLARNLTSALGWKSSFAHQYSADQQPLVGQRPVDSTPALLMTSLPVYTPLIGGTKLFLSRNTANLVRNSAYDVCQWPIWMLPSLPFIEDIDFPTPVAVSASSISGLAENAVVSTPELDAILGPILKAATPLGGSAHKELYRFVSICAGLMEGGLPVAADWGILLWIIPALERGSKQYTSVKALLDEYPLSLSKL